MNIAGTSYKIQPFGQPKIERAIKWTSAGGYPYGSDRGAAQDVYYGSVRFMNTEAIIDNLQNTLDANREGLTLSSFDAAGEDLFGPEVSYAGSISTTVVDMGVRSHPFFTKVSLLEVTFRAISPTLRGTTPSLSALRVQEGWDGDKATAVVKSFAYDQTAFYHDSKADEGKFRASFLQKPADARAILGYLLVTARAAAFTFPTIAGVTYPFGRPKGAGPFNAKCTGLAFERANLNRWKLDLEFSEAP